MLFLYRITINLILLFSPIIILYRLIKKKEDPTRFLEKYSITSKKRLNGKLIWFHGSSVGEILSMIPLVEKLEKNKNIKQILLTSSTLSSSNILSSLNFKKTIHQFFPIDSQYIVRKFLNHWKPKLAIFAESEIWPNMIINLNEKKIPKILINARITKKTFKNWKKINFYKKIFNSFDLTMPQDNISERYLKKLGSKNIKNVGNLKFCETKKNLSKNYKEKISPILKNKKILFCALSTHEGEEIFCAKLHKTLKKKYKNFITIIIPRHVERSKEIIKQLENMHLNVHSHKSREKLNSKCDIYLVDTYGETKKFLKISKIAFLGGSIIDHRGHNPFEAVRLGCRVIHGPHISNHLEAFKLLNKIKIATKVSNVFDAKKVIIRDINNQSNTKKIEKKLIKIADKILIKNLKELERFIW